MISNQSDNLSDENSIPDSRPPIWVGHVSMETSNLEATLAFLQFIGMRSVATFAELAVLELRGGTHLVVRAKQDLDERKATFDLMVEDLPAQHQSLIDQGYSPSSITSGKIHRSFVVTEPGGTQIKFNDSHAVGPV